MSDDLTCSTAGHDWDDSDIYRIEWRDRSGAYRHQPPPGTPVRVLERCTQCPAIRWRIERRGEP